MLPTTCITLIIERPDSRQAIRVKNPAVSTKADMDYIEVETFDAPVFLATTRRVHMEVDGTFEPIDYDLDVLDKMAQMQSHVDDANQALRESTLQIRILEAKLKRRGRKLRRARKQLAICQGVGEGL